MSSSGRSSCPLAATAPYGPRRPPLKNRQISRNSRKTQPARFLPFCMARRGSHETHVPRAGDRRSRARHCDSRARAERPCGAGGSPRYGYGSERRRPADRDMTTGSAKGSKEGEKDGRRRSYPLPGRTRLPACRQRLQRRSTATANATAQGFRTGFADGYSDGYRRYGSNGRYGQGRYGQGSVYSQGGGYGQRRRVRQPRNLRPALRRTTARLLLGRVSTTAFVTATRRDGKTIARTVSVRSQAPRVVSRRRPQLQQPLRLPRPVQGWTTAAASSPATNKGIATATQQRKAGS